MPGLAQMQDWCQGVVSRILNDSQDFHTGSRKIHTDSRRIRGLVRGGFAKIRTDSRKIRVRIRDGFADIRDGFARFAMDSRDSQWSHTHHSEPASVGSCTGTGWSGHPPCHPPGESSGLQPALESLPHSAQRQPATTMTQCQDEIFSFSNCSQRLKVPPFFVV